MSDKKPRSNSAKGNYYKLRTKKWLEAKGYQVAYLERMMWLPPKTPGDRMIPIAMEPEEALAAAGVGADRQQHRPHFHTSRKKNGRKK